MGDVVCTLPVACALRSQFPDCHITWAVSPTFAPLVERCDAVNRVEAVLAKGSRIIDEIRRIRTWEPFDIAIDAQGLTKSAAVVGAAKADQKVGYHWQRELAPFFSQKVKPDPTSLHVVDQYVDVARAVGCQVDRAQFALKPREDDLEAVAAFGLPRDYAVIHPGGGWATKRWAVENFVAVARRLVEQGTTPILIGTAPEAPSAAEIAAQVPEAINLVSKTNLGALVALIQGARLHVGGDTGSTHIAAALGIPAVGIYLVTRPERSCPYGQFNHCPEPTREKILQLVERLA